MATVKQIRRVFSAERVDTHWAFCEVIDLLKQLLLFDPIFVHLLLELIQTLSTHLKILL